MTSHANPIQSLSAWYSREARDLPWRHAIHPYKTWVSELMLQQTQVATVIPYFVRWMERFPDVTSLAEAPEDEVLKFWSGLGYYSRARNLHAGAKAIIANDGTFPDSVESWRRIRGVGPYTAGAICSIAFEQAVPLVDGNVERVLCRVRGILDGVKAKRRLWHLADLLVRTAAAQGVKPSNWNQSLMELGARVCTPRSPKCDQCPVQTHCRATRTGNPETYPQKVARTPTKRLQEWALIVEKDGKLLLTRDPGARWKRGLWDLPVSQTAIAGEVVGEVIYTVTHHRISRTVVRAKKSAVSAEVESVWLRVDEIASSLPVGSALKKALRLMETGKR